MIKSIKGFSLIEVLLALAIVSIALTALILSNSRSITTTERIQDTLIGHWVAKQGVTLLQTRLIAIELNQEIVQATLFYGKKWYWRAKLSPTPVPSLQRITIGVSLQPEGPFQHPLTAFRYSL